MLDETVWSQPQPATTDKLVEQRMVGGLAEHLLQSKLTKPAPGVPTPAQPIQVQPTLLPPTAVTAQQPAEHQQSDAKVNNQTAEQADQALSEQPKAGMPSEGSAKSSDVDPNLNELQADAKALLKDPEEEPDNQKDTAASPDPKVILHVLDDPAECVWLTLCNPPTWLWHMHGQVAVTLLYYC